MRLKFSGGASLKFIEMVMQMEFCNTVFGYLLWKERDGTGGKDREKKGRWGKGRFRHAFSFETFPTFEGFGLLKKRELIPPVPFLSFPRSIIQTREDDSLTFFSPPFSPFYSIQTSKYALLQTLWLIQKSRGQVVPHFHLILFIASLLIRWNLSFQDFSCSDFPLS